MSRLKTLLLHPDANVRSALRSMLASVPFLQVLGEAVSAAEGLELLDHVGYGVIFVGVDLEAESEGVELARTLRGRTERPALVLLAADESRAYAAFELGALDYIVWPADEQRLETTLEKLRDFKARYREVPEPADWRDAEAGEATDEQTLRLALNEDEQDSFLAALKQAWDSTHKASPEIEKLAVTQDGKTILIPYTQIIFVEAFEDYSYVHTSGQKFLTSHRLKHLEERLEPHRFFRVHRKYLVNMDMVTEIASLPGSNFMLRTAGKTRIELPISRRRITRLKQMLGF
ncbi:two component transcriptional regulator, LytTR family [Paucidesulfovibrio gracilis DSM 16080]|uniref:Two component transcriptional regulator, LytTR family n=1 Tax=Paucidesulfovibrio gracilis DSM 16080 TaxID=1121449 RepID=A0A1T4XYG7_9BACT|nr:LytTR family DNA-binding domain-containing protein [Paucidesulfovibrio gracilis]SKA94433.1 two component transcriptional regulator, LytTR family [Paucidesulfovibrio gracilis DSM 16080]